MFSSLDLLRDEDEAPLDASGSIDGSSSLDEAVLVGDAADEDASSDAWEAILSLVFW